MASYETINGQRVASAVARAFRSLAQAFRAATGCDLLIRSATRLRSEQEAIFRARYVVATQVRGRRVYDYRRWNGVLWARISPAGTVAVPGTSNHEEDGPIGPRALDVYDSGADAGVTRAGTSRANWLRTNAQRFGFRAAGYEFAEPWHIEFQGDPFAGSVAPAGGSSSSVPRYTDADVSGNGDAAFDPMMRAYARAKGWTDFDHDRMKKRIVAEEVNRKVGEAFRIARAKGYRGAQGQPSDAERTGIAGVDRRRADFGARYWKAVQIHGVAFEGLPVSAIDGLPGPQTYNVENKIAGWMLNMAVRNGFI